MTKKNKEPEQVPIYHAKKYPLLSCENPKCDHTFIIISYFKPNCGEEPSIFNQAFFSFCPYCGFEQKKKTAFATDN